MGSIRIGDVWVNPKGNRFKILRWDEHPSFAVTWNETFEREDMLIWPITCAHWQLAERGDGEEREA